MRERQREGEPEKRSVFFGLLQPWRELGEKGERLQRGEIRLLCPTLPQETRREEKGGGDERATQARPRFPHSCSL